MTISDATWDYMRETWKASIPKEYRPQPEFRTPAPNPGRHPYRPLDPQEAKAKSERARIRRQAEFVEQCRPHVPGDDWLLEMYGSGFTVLEISAIEDRPEDLAGISYSAMRKRLIACHPTMDSLWK